MFRWLNRLYWWVAHRTTRRFDRVYIHSLEPGYHDKDEMMLHACFQLLVDFVEEEEPFRVVNWEEDEIHRCVASEIRDLYDWWKNKRPLRQTALDMLPEAKCPEPFACFVKNEKGCLSYGPEERRKEALLYPEYVEAMDSSVKEEEAWEREDDENLARLVKIRPHLWT